MSKCKDLVSGSCLVVITSFLWLVSSCSQPAGNTIPIGTPTFDNSTPAKSQADPFSVFNVNIASYHLIINGMVNTPLSLSYEQIQAYPAVTKKAEIICAITGDVLGNSEDETDEWTGVPLSTLLAKAGIQTGASEVVFTGVEGYSVQLPLKSVLQNSVFLAYKINGQILPQDRGYPLRLVVSGSLGNDWLRWVTNIEVKSTKVSLTNSSAIIQNSRVPIAISGRKLCACLLLGVRELTKPVNQKEA